MLLKVLAYDGLIVTVRFDTRNLCRIIFVHFKHKFRKQVKESVEVRRKGRKEENVEGINRKEVNKIERENEKINFL
jgi:hypothetical protein